MDNSTETNGHNEPQSTAPQERFIDRVRAAARRGANDASQAAEDALPKVKLAAANAVYWAAYGVSFAAVLEWALLEAGCRAGAKAGREAARKWAERVQEQRAREERSSTALLAPALDNPQAGVA